MNFGQTIRRSGRRHRLEYLAFVLIFAGPLFGVAWSVFGMNGGVLAALRSGVPATVIYLVPLSSLVILALAVSLKRYGRRLGMNEVSSRQCRLCLRCRYALTDLPDEGRCPECGEAFTLSGLKSGWERVYPALKRLEKRP